MVLDLNLHSIELFDKLGNTMESKRGSFGKYINLAHSVPLKLFFFIENVVRALVYLS